jgi:hypothetical protein
MHYFSFSCRAAMEPTKSTLGHIMPNLCFCIHGICGSCSAFWCVQGMKRRRTIFQAHVGPIQILQKVHRDTLHRACVFTSGEICGTHSLFWCLWCAKHHRTNFHAQVGPVRFPQIVHGTHYTKLFFVSGGIYVSRSAFRCVRGAKWRHYFSCSSGVGTDFTKSTPRHVTLNYFSCSDWPGTVSTKSTSGHVTPKLCFASNGICVSYSAFRYIWGTKCRRKIFHARVGLVWFPQKVHQDSLRQTYFFASAGIYGSCSAFRFVRGAKQ